MIVLDTNIFIYLANGTLTAQELAKDDLAFPSIAKIEALGYSRITVAEQSYLEALFAECQQLDLNEAVVQRAIRLRQQIKMSLGDAIVAATALEYDSELWTANEEDFVTVEGLKIHNPLNL
jgi:predicted nucleic acid-binding protein